MVKEAKSRKDEGLSLWLLPKNRIQANLALWLEEGSARESGRQIIRAQIQAYLPTSCAYVTLRNRMTPAWGKQHGREEEIQEEEGGRDVWRGCKKEGLGRGRRWKNTRDTVLENEGKKGEQRRDKKVARR